MNQLPVETQRLVPLVVSWASAKNWISEIWLVGCRVRGDFRADSGLDVVVVTNLDGRTAFNIFFFEEQELSDEPSQLLNVRAHICQGDDGYETDEIVIALRAGGVRIYQ